jgi:hypothetical protein
MGKASSAKKIQRVQRAGVSRVAGQRRNLGFPLAIVGIIIVGTLLVFFARGAKVDAGADAPVANQDHWHNAIGVYDCDHYLQNIPNPGTDPEGIHTHADGLIHIHPFTAAAAGKKATMQVFADTVGMQIADDGSSITLPAAMGGQVLKDGADCKDSKGKKQKAKLVMLSWPPQATDKVKPTQVDPNWNNFRFVQDKAILAFALIPENMKIEDVPLPPSVQALTNPLAAEGQTTPQPVSSTTVAGTAAPSTTAPATAATPSTTAPAAAPSTTAAGSK